MHPIRRLNTSKNSRKKRNRLRILTKSLLTRLSRLKRTLFKFTVRFLIKTRQLMMQSTWYLTSSTPMMTVISILTRSKHILLKPQKKLQMKRKFNNFSIKLTRTKMALLTKRSLFNICRNFSKVHPKMNKLRLEPIKSHKLSKTQN